MGMPVTVEVLGLKAASEAIDEVFAYFRRVDAIFSPFKSDSEISRLNRGELALSQLSAEVRSVLDACARLRRLTGGYFDITRGDGTIDPSGYVKGWAVYQAAGLLNRRLITRYCVNAGGDMQLSGEGPGGGPWVVGITNPFDPATLAKRLYIKDMAVATSGTYERGRHIYNPHTGQFVDDLVSLTVVGPTIDRVDALATAAFCMGRTGLAFLREQGLEGMLIDRHGQVMMTAGFRRYCAAQMQ